MSEVIQLEWVSWSKAGARLPLRTVNLSKVSAYGVYIIWHGGSTPRVVRVGQGDIAERLTAHRGDPIILAYEKFGTLYVTWAAVPVRLVDGVERYLAERWRPLIGDRFPHVAPLAVSSPF